ncbi:MAG: hypothetical protein K8I27_06140 [Planctomycetes bacterium]|nr:hypothetical protein [Planctomycetota bacterium]
MAIAFYIEYPRITAVEVSGSARKPKLKRVAVGDLPEPRNEDGSPVVDKQGYLNSQIAAFIKEHKLAGGKHYLLAGPDAMRYRDMTLSFADKRQIDRVLQFQVEGVIPNIPIEKLAIGYNILTATPDGARILVHAAEREYIRERLIALEEGGASVEAVDSHMSGTLNLGLLHPELAKDKAPTLWIDFAGTTATVSVVNAGEVLTSRVFLSPYLAGATGVTATAEDSKEAARHAQAEAEMHARMTQEYVLLEKAEQEDADLEHMAEATLPKAESVNIGEAQVADRIKHMSRDDLLKFIHRVSIEARRTLLMTSLDVEPERLVVSGLGNAGKDITSLLANELQFEDAVAIELMDVMVTPGKDDSIPDIGELSYLTGVALKGLGRDYTKIDFRYGDLAPGTLFDYAKTPLAFTATLVLLFCGILFLISFTHARNYERDVAALRDQERGPEYFFKAAFFYAKEADKISEPNAADLKLREYPEMPEAPGDEIRLAHKRLKETQGRLEGQVDESYAEPHPADQILAEVLKTIERGVPSYDFTLLKIDITESLVTVDYLVSLTETQQERNQIGAGDMKEAERMLASFRTLAAEEGKPEKDKWFDGNPEQSLGGRPRTGPEGREVDQITMKLKLRKIEQPKKAKAPAKTGAE